MNNLLNESYFVVLGLTGSGKSTFINALSNKSCCKVSNKGNSETKISQGVEFYLNNHTFTVVDTPGLGDSEDNEKVINELKTLLANWPFLKKIIIIKPYYETRFAEYLQEALKVMMDAFPLQNFWEHVIIVNNRCVPTDETYQDFLDENPPTFLDNLKQCEKMVDFMKSKNIDIPREIKEFHIDSKKKDKYEQIQKRFNDIIQNIKNSKMMYKTIKSLPHVKGSKDGTQPEIRILYEYDPIECTDFKDKKTIIKKNYIEHTEVKEEFKQKIIKIGPPEHKEEYIGSVDVEWYDVLTLGILWAIRPTEKYKLWEEEKYRNLQTGEEFIEVINERYEVR
jgi:adenylate kinase family enzyme